MLKAGEYRQASEAVREAKWPWTRMRIRMAEYTGGEAAPVRAALELCGRPGGPSRPPSRSLGETGRAELKTLLKQIGAPVV